MPAYSTPPELARRLRAFDQRATRLEMQVANRTRQPPITGGDAYDASVLTGGMEGGIGNWRALYWTTTPGVLSVEAADPLDGLQSLRVDEPAGSFSRVYWRLPAPAATVDGDAFSTAPGQVWQLTALIRASVSLPDAQLVASCGTAPGDVFGIFGAQDWVAAASVPLVGGYVAALSGTITVPAGRNYIGLMAVASDSGLPTDPWTWWLDDVTLQRKLT